MSFLLNTDSSKFFEDESGFVYKRVNENERIIYLNCLNDPLCLAAARYYKNAKQFRLFGNHNTMICPPDDKEKPKSTSKSFWKKLWSQMKMPQSAYWTCIKSSWRSVQGAVAAGKSSTNLSSNFASNPQLPKIQCAEKNKMCWNRKMWFCSIALLYATITWCRFCYGYHVNANCEKHWKGLFTLMRIEMLPYIIKSFWIRILKNLLIHQRKICILLKVQVTYV